MKKIKIILVFTLLFMMSVAIQAKADISTPIIIIPGILGSWNADVLLSNNSGGTWNFVPYDHTYDRLVKAFQDAGYVKDKNLFIAFYDWRESNINSATDYLIPTINKALANSTTGKVDIVAHSMGGLVARRYIESTDYRGDVDKLILLGTPNNGASDAYTLWEGGRVPDNWDLTLRELLKTYLAFEKTTTLNTSDNYDVIHQYIPSIQDLLPMYDYLYDSNSGNYISNSMMTDQNPFLANLDQNRSNLKLLGSITTIAGENRNTLDSIPYTALSGSKLWTDGEPTPLPPIPDDPDGDGTVLSWSALLTPNYIYPPILVQNPFQRFFSFLLPSAYAAETHIPIVAKTIDSDHLGLPTNAIPDIFEALGLIPPATTSAPISGPDEVLTYVFASPVSVKIIDPNGLTITSTSSTMSNAIYSGTSDPNGPKIVFISNPIKGKYNVELTGSANGSYHMAVLDENDATSTEQVVQKNVALGEKVSYTVNFDPQGSTSTTAISAPQELNATSTPTTTPVIKTATDQLGDLIKDTTAYLASGKISKTAYKPLSVDLSAAFASLTAADALKSKQTPKFPTLNAIAIKALQDLAKIALAAFKLDVSGQKGKGVEAVTAADLTSKANNIIALIK